MFGVSNLLLLSSIGAAGFIYFAFRLIQNRRFYSKLVCLQFSSTFPPPFARPVHDILLLAD